MVNISNKQLKTGSVFDWTSCGKLKKLDPSYFVWVKCDNYENTYISLNNINTTRNHICLQNKWVLLF